VREGPARGSPRISTVIAAAIFLLVIGASASCSAGTAGVSTPGIGNAPAIALAETPVGLAPTTAPTDIAGAPIGSGYRISVPRLGIDLPIAEGDITRDTLDQRTPEGFAFHLPGTTLPGQRGNTYLYAHARQGMFLALWNARQGDEVFIATPAGQVLTFVVREILPRVAPTDVSSTQPTTMERLTLQTSTGPSPLDPRFVLFAFPRGG